MACKITILLENSAPAMLEAEHGLSLFLESQEKTILFDTGNTDLFCKTPKSWEFIRKRLIS